MIEGWNNGEHFILFDSEETSEATHRYRLRAILPEYVIVGLKGWDEFILRSPEGELFSVPTVPLIPEYMAPLTSEPPSNLEPGEQAGKIKWHIQPIVFGGSPDLGENVIWVDHLTHSDLVYWWNQKYRETVSAGM